MSDEHPYEAELNAAGEVIDKRPYMDPVTGDRYDTPGLATGHPERPHPPIPVVKVSNFAKWAKGEGAEDDGDDTATPPAAKTPTRRKPSSSRKRKTASASK